MASNFLNRWVLLLLGGIVIQTFVYPVAWVFQLFSHAYFLEVFIIGVVSVGVQLVGFLVIVSKTRGADPAIYSQGRPFKHKLREEDEAAATRKPTYSESGVH
ncbi:MAG: hypothetical protein HXY34_07425 [Candidatus Thorarchaeota archaeon]|nr:hypothetical protein [Candidatus Thorarchaeota archaeon]